ncbi:unnamed protein product [Lampetra planeri]
MNCVLEGSCVKAFGKAVHALSRVGDDVWLDPMVKGLALRSVNCAHSSYGCFLFSPPFFQHYSLNSQQDAPTVQCKLLMKSLLPLFRCLTSIERNVKRCQLSISVPNSKVIIQFYCRHGITKTHNLCYQDSEALQAVFASHLCPNVLKAPARLLGDMVVHFPASQEEITLSITPLRVSLRNYHEGGNVSMKMTYTEMSLHSDEFDYFESGGDSDITFCLKELRGFLSFAELHGLPVSVHFGAAGTCSDAAASPRHHAQVIPAMVGLVPSSQGSPDPEGSQVCPCIQNVDRLDGPDEDLCRSDSCCLLGLYLRGRMMTARHRHPPVLACHSDTEDDAMLRSSSL